MRLAVKALRMLDTALLMLLAGQFAVALAGEFAPASGIGRVLYPVYLGLHPWSLPHAGANLLLLTAAFGAMYFADRLERELDMGTTLS